MSKLREAYINSLRSNICHNYQSYILRDDADRYIQELEQENKKMLDELIKLYDTVFNTQHECYWQPMKEIIESVTGKTIEEVIK
jgi:hypothetical protein